MLKGKTRIELTDIHTGEVEVIEKENMITNALQYIFNPFGYIKLGSVMYGAGFVNYFENLTGGLLLLDHAVTEDADNIFLGTDVGLTGCAVYNKQNTSGQTLRGNYNATESELDLTNRRIKYVYDFDTAEGNGTIASVALTHAFGGYSNRGCEEEPVRGEYPLFMRVASGTLRYTGTNCNLAAYDNTMSFTSYGSNRYWIFLMDYEKDIVYYFTIMDSTTIRIRGYRANMCTVSLFDNPSTERILVYEKSITCTTPFSSTQYFAYNYDEEAEKLYLFFATGYNISNNGNFSVVEIDVANDYAVTQYAMQNKTGVALRMFYDKNNVMCYQGYLYLMALNSPRNIYRVELGNSANVQKSDATVRESYPAFAKDNRVYYVDESPYSDDADIYIVETDTFTIKYPETQCLVDTSSRQFVPVKGVPMMYFMTSGVYDGEFAFRTDYLATINNLQSAVVKTADKTMKVTYTLTEE